MSYLTNFRFSLKMSTSESGAVADSVFVVSDVVKLMVTFEMMI